MYNPLREIIGKHPSHPSPVTVVTIGHPRRVVWKSDTVIVFQDDSGKYWRYCRDSRQVGSVIVEGGK